VRDAQSRPKTAAAHAENYGVFGARNIRLTLNRQRARDEAPIARCTVERLMAGLGMSGAVRGYVKRTMITDPAQPSARRLSPWPGSASINAAAPKVSQRTESSSSSALAIDEFPEFDPPFSTITVRYADIGRSWAPGP
jgi:hypothetical protein